MIDIALGVTFGILGACFIGFILIGLIAKLLDD